MIATHWLHIYDKPAVGSSFLTRYAASDYKHRIISNGGNDTMSCNLHVSVTEADLIFSAYVGNRVAVFVDNPVMPIWEGLISRVTLQHDGLKSTISLDEMANRVTTFWRQGNSGGSTPQANKVTSSNDTNSQALYGVKETMLNAGYEVGSTATRASSLQSLYLALHSFPIISTVTSASSSGAIISIEAIGLYQTLDWEQYFAGPTSVADVDVILQTALDNMSNGTTFFDNTDATGLTANSSFTTSADQKTGQSILDLLHQFTEPGDGADRWIFGVEPNGSSQRVYYRPASSAILYTGRKADALRICNVSGRYVRPWTVRPDGVFRVLDNAIGHWKESNYINSPNEFYISSISYDANSQRVDLQGDDNITIEGIYQFGSYAKPFNRRFGWKIADAVVY